MMHIGHLCIIFGEMFKFFDNFWIKFLLVSCTSYLLLSFSCSVMSDSLQPHGLQHARLPCPSPTTEAGSNSCPSLCDSMDCSMPALPVPHCLPKFAQIHVHCIMSSSHLILCHPFSFCPQSFQASETFPMNQLFTSDDQNTGASASAYVPSEYSRLISLKIDCFDLLVVQGTFRSVPQHQSSKASIL